MRVKVMACCSIIGRNSLLLWIVTYHSELLLHQENRGSCNRSRQPASSVPDSKGILKLSSSIRQIYKGQTILCVVFVEMM
jgi:hypothetical protein